MPVRPLISPIPAPSPFTIHSSPDCLHQRLSEPRRRRRNLDACPLHRLDLAFRAALATGDNRAGMAHGAAFGRRTARDEAGHRLLPAALCLVENELCGILLGGAADLADHDDGFRLVV